MSDGNVKVTFLYTPEDGEADGDHAMGVSDAGYESICDAVAGIGGFDIEIEKAPAS